MQQAAGFLHPICKLNKAVRSECKWRRRALKSTRKIVRSQICPQKQDRWEFGSKVWRALFFQRRLCSFAPSII